MKKNAEVTNDDNYLRSRSSPFQSDDFQPTVFILSVQEVPFELMYCVSELYSSSLSIIQDTVFMNRTFENANIVAFSELS